MVIIFWYFWPCATILFQMFRSKKFVQINSKVWEDIFYIVILRIKVGVGSL